MQRFSSAVKGRSTNWCSIFKYRTNNSNENI